MKKQHPFNMVEILLALGVIAIGICSVMVLFPVGANASRDSIMEEYAATSAEQMLNMINFRLHMYDPGTHSTTKYWNDYIGTTADGGGHLTPVGSTGRPSDSDIEGMNTKLDLDSASDWSSTNSLLGGSALEGSIFSYSGSNNYFQVVVHKDTPAASLSSIQADLIDFRALGVLWVDKVDFNGTNLPYTMAARLNLELSWPVEIPYASRQKAYYTLEVFK